MLGEFLDGLGDTSGVADFGLELGAEVDFDGQKTARGGLDKDLGHVDGDGWGELWVGEVRGPRGGRGVGLRGGCPRGRSM